MTRARRAFATTSPVGVAAEFDTGALAAVTVNVSDMREDELVEIHTVGDPKARHRVAALRRRVRRLRRARGVR